MISEPQKTLQSTGPEGTAVQAADAGNSSARTSAVEGQAVPEHGPQHTSS